MTSLDTLDGGFATLSHAVEELARAHDVRGAVFGCSDGGSLRTDAWGEVDVVAGRTETTSDHRFLLTSITKVLTATQVMHWSMSGHLDLDAAISARVPEFGVGGKGGVTAAHILTHTSGISPGPADTAEQPHGSWGAERHIAAALAASSERPAGTRVEYCSSPFWALSLYAERATGVDRISNLRELMASRGCPGLGYQPDAVPPSDLALPAVPIHAQLAEQARTVAYPAGGAVGSIHELLTFAAAFLPVEADLRGDDRLLDDETLDQMCRSHTTGLPGNREPDGDASGTERAIGWGLGGPGRTRRDDVLFHRGVSGTALWVDRRRPLVAAFLSAAWFLPRAFYAGMADLIFGAMDQSPSQVTRAVRNDASERQLRHRRPAVVTNVQDREPGGHAR